jgi:hypothetical protein
MHGAKTIQGEEAESGQTVVGLDTVKEAPQQWAETLILKNTEKATLESSVGDKQGEFAKTVTGTKPTGTMTGST